MSAGKRVGLLGGSFNPAHRGHRRISLFALRSLRLDEIWWLVSPGNPLKDNSGLWPLEERIAAARKLITTPGVHVTGFEAAYGFRYTFDTLSHLKARLKDRKLVWIMGADNLASFHHWEHWRDIAELLPMAVYVRPGNTRKATTSPAATTLARHRIDETDAALLPDLPAPAWVFLNGIMCGLSSTAIRAASTNTGRQTLS